MLDVPTNAYRVWSDASNVKRLAYIAPNGVVIDLIPDDKVKALADGYYTRKFDLICANPKPAWLKRHEAGI